MIQIQKLHEDATIPTLGTSHAAGYDLYALEDATLETGSVTWVRTGIAVAIPEGYAGFVQPRSGLAFKHGVTVVNSPGLIDADYRGEVKIAMTTIGLINNPFAAGGSEFQRAIYSITAGERVAQLVIQKVETPGFVEVDELPETVRGNGGFGSTGL